MYLFYRARDKELILVKEDNGDVLEEHLKRLDLMGFDLDRVVISNTWISTYIGDHSKRYHSMAVNHAISVVLRDKPITDAKIGKLLQYRITGFLIAKLDILTKRYQKAVKTLGFYSSLIICLLGNLHTIIEYFKSDINIYDANYKKELVLAIRKLKSLSKFTSQEIAEWKKSHEPMTLSKV